MVIFLYSVVKGLFLRSECESADEVCLLRGGVRGDTGEEGHGPALGDLDVLGGAQRYVCHGEAIGLAIERCGIRHGTHRRCPVEVSKLERYGSLDIRTVGALAALVHTIVAGEIGIPVQRYRTKIVPDVTLEDVTCGMGVVVEILLIGCVEPVIGDADVEPACLISGREVKLLRVTVVREPYRAPSCEREAFVGYTQCGLYGYVTEIDHARCTG